MILPERGISRLYRIEFQAWADMRDRCTRPKNRRWADYGGRGIRVCNRWQNSFRDFLTDMGTRPSPGHSLDRFPDNNGGYWCGRCEECIANNHPLNCRWASREEQQANRRQRRDRGKSGKLYEVSGESNTIIGWAEKTGISAMVIATRLRRGWGIEDAVTAPTWSKHHGAMEATLNGKTQTIRRWAIELGFRDIGIIYERLGRGWSVEDALLTPAGPQGKPK